MKKTFQKTLIAVAAGARLMPAVGTSSASAQLGPPTSPSGTTTGTPVPQAASHPA